MSSSKVFNLASRISQSVQKANRLCDQMHLFLPCRNFSIYQNDKSLFSVNRRSSFLPDITVVRFSKKSGENSSGPTIVTPQITEITVSKKRLPRKEVKNSVVRTVRAFATAEEYDLERVKASLITQRLYGPISLTGDHVSDGNTNAIYAEALYRLNDEDRFVFFFRNGAIVCWNMSQVECLNIIQFLKTFQVYGYDDNSIRTEEEYMTFSYVSSQKRSSLNGEHIYLCSNGLSKNNLLDKYTFSNAIALSVKLGVWEKFLQHYIHYVGVATEDLRTGGELKYSRKKVLQKTGQLFSLKHSVNLNSDLLGVPDFYWDKPQLETLFLKMRQYFEIGYRTKVFNERLSHCLELITLLSSHLTDEHHVRLEWLIIILITIEVIIEIVHNQHLFSKILLFETPVEPPSSEYIKYQKLKPRTSV